MLLRPALRLYCAGCVGCGRLVGTVVRSCPCLPATLFPTPVQLLLSMRLPLVFDLDETLLVAKSQSQLSKELKALRDVR